MSGATRFSTGTATRSLSSASAALARCSRAAASGSRDAHRAGAGGPSCSPCTVGSSVAGAARARATARSQESAPRLCMRPEKTGSSVNAATVVGRFCAASMMALSGRMRCGAMSRRRAISSRACHSSRTTASARRSFTRCRPEVRRHGSARGGAGGASTMAANSCRAHVQLALLVQQRLEPVPQFDQHLDIQRGVHQPVVGERSGRPVCGAVSLAQVQAEQVLHQWAETDPR